jgi:hypothetical protein
MTSATVAFKRRVQFDQPMPESAQLRRPALALAASEPPRGRILLAEARADVALDLQLALREAGWRAIGPAASTGSVRALASRCRPDGAVVDLDGLDRAGAEIADFLAAFAVPFVFMASGRDPVPVRHGHRLVVYKPYLASKLLDALEQAIGKPEHGLGEGGIAGSVSAAPFSRLQLFPQL